MDYVFIYRQLASPLCVFTGSTLTRSSRLVLITYPQSITTYEPSGLARSTTVPPSPGCQLPGGHMEEGRFERTGDRDD